MSKTVKFQNGEKQACAPLAPISEADELQSHKTNLTVTVFSRHNLPEKGYESNQQRAKAFSTVIGGVIWMLVSISQYHYC